MIYKQNRLLENIFSMVTLRGMEYILAFLLVPYLLRTLGPTYYGSIAFMQGIVSYFALFIHYGFNITAPKDIALASKEELPKIFSSYFWGTFFLMLLCSLVFSIGYTLSYILFKLTIDLPLFVACYMSAIGIAVFPVWFFQGVQEMRYITILNLICRFIFIGLMFYLIQSPEDYILAAFLQSSTTFFAGLLSFGIIFKKWPEILKKPEWKEIVIVYKKGWQIFISSLAVNLYTSTDIVILGILTNSTIVGYYSGAEKLINCVRRGIGAVSDAIYPYISQTFQESKETACRFLRKQLVIYTVGGSIGGVLIIFFSPSVVPWLLGNKYVSSIELLQVLAFVPCMVAISNIWGYETMLPLGMQSTYSRILIAASVLNLVIVFPAIMFYKAIGVAICVLLTETFITIVMGWVLWRKRILF